jgi:hypothetical protein
VSLRGRLGRLEASAESDARRLAEAHAPRLGRTVESLLPEARRALAKLRRALGGRYPAGVVGLVIEMLASPGIASPSGLAYRERLGINHRRDTAAARSHTVSKRVDESSGPGLA